MLQLGLLLLQVVLGKHLVPACATGAGTTALSSLVLGVGVAPPLVAVNVMLTSGAVTTLGL